MPRDRAVREVCFRRRSVVLSERDELAFSRVLREFAPNVLMWEYGKGHDGIVPNIPSANWRAVIAFPSPEQKDFWNGSDHDDKGLIRRYGAFFYYDRARWEWVPIEKKWVFDPPTMGTGMLDGYFPCGEPELEKFVLRVTRLLGKVTRYGSLGLDASIWSQTGGVIRRSLSGGPPLDPAAKITLNKYYDDSLWEDRLPPVSKKPGAEYLEWHEHLRQERSVTVDTASAF
jgi:hypothetical protein